MKKKPRTRKTEEARTVRKYFERKKYEHLKFCLIVNHKLRNVSEPYFALGFKSIRTTSNRVYCECIYVFGISLQRRLHSKLNSLFLRKFVWLELHTTRYAIILFHSTLLFFDSPALSRFLILHFLFNFVTSVRNSFDVLYSPIITDANSLSFCHHFSAC